MPDMLRVWTREEVLALPDDGNRYELVAGQLLVSPSPRLIHQIAVARLYDLVSPYVRAHRLGACLFAPADIQLGDDLVQPDLFVVPPGGDGRRRPVEWKDVALPILIAEVTSFSTARYDRTTKRRRYQEARVEEYWIVDVDARIVERWTPDDDRPEIVDRCLTWSPSETPAPAQIDLVQYFRDVWGEEA